MDLFLALISLIQIRSILNRLKHLNKFEFHCKVTKIFIYIYYLIMIARPMRQSVVSYIPFNFQNQLDVPECDSFACFINSFFFFFLNVGYDLT